MSDAASESPRSGEYVRFVILCAARTGSNMLASSLNTSPRITCFRELFGMAAGFIDYNVDGYDNHNPEDRALRDADFRAFLQERIFCEHSKSIRAVGFKMPYEHFRWFPGLLEFLAENEHLRVLHLQRRNMLRNLVSLKIAQATGGWVEDRKVPLPSVLSLQVALRAARHPLRAATLMRRMLWPKPPAWKVRRQALALTPDECLSFFQSVERDNTHYASRFQAQPLLPVYYEDLLRHRNRTFSQVQSFLGLQPSALGVATRRQNPEPLRELIENYDELYDEFTGTQYAAFFD